MESESSKISFLLTIVLLLLALVLPFAYRIDVGPGPDSIRAMIWDYIESSWYSGFRLWNPFDTLPYTLLRIIFTAMLGRSYQNDKLHRRTLLVGVLAEVQPFAISAPLVYLIDWSGDPYVPLYVPIPVFFILGISFLLIMRYRKQAE